MKQLKINGPIISNDDKWFYEWLELDGTCPNDILSELDGSDVEVTINSYGGLVDEGNEIYTALRNNAGYVKVNIVMAGSAASIIAMAGDTVAISPVGQIMIHNVQMGAGGDYHDMDKASEILRKANESLAIAYQIKTGKSKEEVLALMDKETWLTAEEAKTNGFVDEIMFETTDKMPLVADFGGGLIPGKVIDKMKKLKNKAPVTEIKLDSEKLKELVSEGIEELKQNTIINGKTLAELMEENKEPTNESPFARFLF